MPQHGLGYRFVYILDNEEETVTLPSHWVRWVVGQARMCSFFLLRICGSCRTVTSYMGLVGLRCPSFLRAPSVHIGALTFYRGRLTHSRMEANHYISPLSQRNSRAPTLEILVTALLFCSHPTFRMKRWLNELFKRQTSEDLKLRREP